MENTSGQGKAAVVPDEVRGWSWGAFLLNWIWGLFNRTWIALAVLLPVIGFVVWIILGLKGNEWAWRNKRWDDVEHFKRVQRKWAIAGLVVLLLPVVAIGVAVLLLGVSLDSFVDTPPPPPPAKSAPAVTKAAPAAKVPVPAAAKAPVGDLAAPVAAKAVVDAATPAAKAKVPGPAIPAPVTVAEAPAAATLPAPAKASPSRAAAPRKAPPAAPAPKAAPAPEPVAGPPGMAVVAVVPEPVRPTPTMPSPRYNDVMTPVVFGDAAGVREALAFGRFVDQRDSNGFTPLIVAAMRRDLAAARLLLDGGANPRLVGGTGQSAMSVARANGDAGMVALLRRYGVPD